MASYSARILVVDDEPRMTRFIRMNLELEGYVVIEAHNGLEALEKARTELPDLVLLDVMMPELDGFETLEMLRETSNVPVIMLTVRADEEDDPGKVVFVSLRVAGLGVVILDVAPTDARHDPLVVRVCRRP